jgi:hypothetical protein
MHVAAWKIGNDGRMLWGFRPRHCGMVQSAGQWKFTPKIIAAVVFELFWLFEFKKT